MYISIGIHLILLSLISISKANQSNPNIFDDVVYNERFVGSKTVRNDNTFPWTCALRSDLAQFCTGSLISEYWIITSAQCVYGSSSVEVACGTVELDEPRISLHSELIKIHPNFKAEDITFGYNIGLLKLMDKIVFTRQMTAIHLPFEELNRNALVNQTCTICGFGKLYALQYVLVKIQDKNVCKGFWKNGGICTSYGIVEDNLGYAGDSLVYYHDFKYYLIGVYSGILFESKYNGFTSVHFHLDWINRILNRDP